MTCDVCGGTNKLPLVDVWQWIRKTKQEKQDQPMPLIEGCPCPECNEDDAIGFVTALIDKYGQPDMDGEIGMLSLWNDPAGRPCLIPKPDDRDD